jgi:hypothetical protein
VNFHHFLKNSLKKNTLSQIESSFKKQKTFHQNSLQLHERIFKILFLLSYFEYHQIWLNILPDDDHDLSKNITKIRKTKKKKRLVRSQKFLALKYNQGDAKRLVNMARGPRMGAHMRTTSSQNFINNIHLLYYYYNNIRIVYYNMCGHDINVSWSEVGVPLASLC